MDEIVFPLSEKGLTTRKVADHFAGLKELPRTVNTFWELAVVQTVIAHLICSR